jgi:restriction endonuclease S subunit
MVENRSYAKNWKYIKLKDICEVYSEQILPNSEFAKKLPYIGLENIESETGNIINQKNGSDSKLSKGNTFRFNSHHVLYGKLRPYLNKVATPNFEGRCSTELLPLLPKCIMYTCDKLENFFKMAPDERTTLDNLLL